MMKRKLNPILAAIELSLKGQRPLAIMDGWHTLPKETQLDITGGFSPQTRLRRPVVLYSGRCSRVTSK
jgi:hypothetical protein